MIYWGKNSSVEKTKTEISSTVSEGKQFWICTKLKPGDNNHEQKRMLSKALECRSDIPHFFVIAQAQVAKNNP